MTDRRPRAPRTTVLGARLRHGACLVVLLWWLPWSMPCAAQVILDFVPGGLAQIPLGPLNRPRPKALFGQERILVMEFGKRWVGLIGLPLTLVPGAYAIQVQLDEDEDAVTRDFTVYPRRVDTHPVLQVPDSPVGTPEVRFTWRDVLEAKLPLQPPVAAPAEPLFGHYRRTSGTASTYVNFVGFRVQSDASVRAPGSGHVDAVKTHGSGIYVWIDHGMNLFTCVGPLTRAQVHAGDTVKAGQRLGRIILDTAAKPKTLYWSVFLNGAAVDPFLIAHLRRGPLPTAPTRGDSG